MTEKKPDHSTDIEHLENLLRLTDKVLVVGLLISLVLSFALSGNFLYIVLIVALLTGLEVTIRILKKKGAHREG